MQKDGPSLGRNFYLFLTANTLSSMGDIMGMMAVAWWALSSSTNSAPLMWIMGPAIIVRLFLGPFLGTFADRTDRKKMILISEFSAGVIWLLLTLVSKGDFVLSQVFILFFLNSITQTAFKTAASGYLQEMVPPALFPRALSMNQSFFASSKIIAASLGGVIIGFAGHSWVFALNFISFTLSFTLLFTIKRSMTARQVREKQGVSMSQGLKEGISLFKNSPLLLFVALIIGSVQFILIPLDFLLPVLVKFHSSKPAWFLGMMESATGIGSLVGGIYMGFRRKRLHGLTYLLISLFTIGASLMALGYFSATYLSMPFLAAMGAGFIFLSVPLRSRVLAWVPGRFHSRLQSVLGGAIELGGLVGVLFWGRLEHSVSMDLLFYAMGGIFFTLMILVVSSKELRMFLSLPPKRLSENFAYKHPSFVQEPSDPSLANAQRL